MPDLVGVSGRAWKVTKPDTLRSPAQAASLESFLVNVPNAHPFWAFWIVSVIHLRDLPGVPPAKKTYPEATHEFLIVSLNPEKGPPNPDDIETLHPLTPPDVSEQFSGVTDAQAVAVNALCVRAIVDGLLSPDSDYRRLWAQVIRNTVEHAATGGHAKERA